MLHISMYRYFVISRSGTDNCLCLLAIIVLLYAAPVAAMGTGDNRYCGHTQQRHFSVFSERLQDAELDDSSPGDSGLVDSDMGDSSEVSYESRGISSGLASSRSGETTTSVGFDYRYTILGFEGAARPDTNGHLHSIIVPITGRDDRQDRTVEYYLAPALSVSSNALKNPDLIDADALQLRAGLWYRKAVDDRQAWFAGLRADYRFGPYRLYPVAGYCWKPDDTWQFQLAFPDFSITRYFTGGVSIGLFASPDGNRWHVFNKDKTRQSDFAYNAIVSGISVDWQINRSVGLSIGIISHSRRRLSYLDETGISQETSASSAIGYAVSASIIF